MKGFLKSATNQAGHFFLADGEMSDSLFSFRNERSRKYDMGLVAQVRDFRTEQEQPEHTLDIIHLIGQHFDYDMRYPQDEATFSVNDYAARTLDAEAKKIVMQYDNATHYNDMVLDSLLSIYDHEDAVVLYVADHGEEVYDDLQLHGRLFQEPTAAQARYEFEVPMWIWCSERYRQQHPDVVSRIREATNKPLMTDALPQLLLSLAGITCPWSDERRNPLSVNYQGKRRIIGGSTDYDELMKPMPTHR
jgi:heptose-I-phosphate ethanolaminephosphotransferase